jgi:hypothetical protein
VTPFETTRRICRPPRHAFAAFFDFIAAPLPAVRVARIAASLTPPLLLAAMTEAAA